MIDPVRRERLGSALHAMAAELVTERRRIAELERENDRLRARVETLERQLRMAAGEPVNDHEDRRQAGSISAKGGHDVPVARVYR